MFGVCYYPEHWPESQWDEDAKMMADLGLTYVRIGEFAWSRLEPNPGEYDFAWLDKSVGTLANIATDLSSQAKSYSPGLGSRRDQANSPIRT